MSPVLTALLKRKWRKGVITFSSPRDKKFKEVLLVGYGTIFAKLNRKGKKKSTTVLIFKLSESSEEYSWKGKKKIRKGKKKLEDVFHTLINLSFNLILAIKKIGS